MLVNLPPNLFVKIPYAGITGIGLVAPVSWIRRFCWEIWTNLGDTARRYEAGGSSCDHLAELALAGVHIGRSGKSTEDALNVFREPNPISFFEVDKGSMVRGSKVGRSAYRDDYG